MRIISRIKFPSMIDKIELYLKSGQDSKLHYDESDGCIYLTQGEIVSSNTYFNSLYEPFYAKYTTLKSVYYKLNLLGDFTLSIYREKHGSRDRQLLHCQSLTDCQFSHPVQVNIPTFAEDSGRIYFELTCVGDRGLFKESWIATDESPQRTVNLGIISCTYKKEAYITKTVNTILNDSLLHQKSYGIFVIDNGQTLDQQIFQDDRVHLIPNRNVGGSGGFTRGLVEALKNESYTHFLFMDDDVELDSEVIYRLFLLYEYAESDFAIAGAMLDLHERHLLFEAGAKYASSLFRDGFEPFELTPLKTDLDLRRSKSLNSLLVEEPVDYGGFWFFAFPKSFVEKIGLPLPFFIKGDDIEFGLRISRQLQEKIIAFPTIAVWHEPFYTKFPIWDRYYYFRNFLAIHAMHGSLSYFKAVKDITVRLIYMLLFFDYNSASMMIKGFEDYLQGPDLLKQLDAETYHSDIVKLSKSHQNQSIDYTFKPEQPTTVANAGILQKIASLVTLNGHFLPDFLVRQEPALIWYAPGYPGQRSRAFARKKVLIFKEKMACLYTYEMDKQSGLKILQNWFILVWRNSSRWAEVNHAWKQSSQEFVSLRFWQQYLHLS